MQRTVTAELKILSLAFFDSFIATEEDVLIVQFLNIAEHTLSNEKKGLAALLAETEEEIRELKNY